MTPSLPPALLILVGMVVIVIDDCVYLNRQINACVAAYYQDLYASEATHSEEAVAVYLEDIDLSSLTDTYRDKMDSPITLEELQLAVKSLQWKKTPGPNDLPAELFKKIC